MIAAAYILILTALAGTPQTRCYQNTEGWKQQKVAMGVSATALAYYDPQMNYIALGPMACKQVRLPTQYGAYIYAHEIAHWRQDRSNMPYDEDDADERASRFWPGWLRKLEDYFNRNAKP